MSNNCPFILFSAVWFFFYWRIIALQYCVGFCHTSTWISHRLTYVTSLFPEDTLVIISRCAVILLNHSSFTYTGISHYDLEQGFQPSLASSQRYTVQDCVRQVFLLLFHCTVKPSASLNWLSPVAFLQPKISLIWRIPLALFFSLLSSVFNAHLCLFSCKIVLTSQQG